MSATVPTQRVSRWSAINGSPTTSRRRRNRGFPDSAAESGNRSPGSGRIISTNDWMCAARLGSLEALRHKIRSAARRGPMPLLFSYGTLRQESVQISTFGRPLRGWDDEIVGFEQSLLKIDDPAFVAASGKAYHAIVTFNGRNDCRVRG